MKEIEQAAMQYLARREHSRVELRRKLLTKFADGEAVEAALENLARNKYLSDVRYAASLIRHRANQGYGLNYIRQELKRQGVDNEDMSAALEEADLDWLQVAQDLYGRKFKKPVSDFKEKAKRMRYLYAHGFDQDIIAQLIK